MTALTFDTLKFARKLEGVGMPRDHAFGLAESLAEVQHESTGELATKAELKSELEKLELRMTIKFGMMQAGTLGILIAAMKYLIK